MPNFANKTIYNLNYRKIVFLSIISAIVAIGIILFFIFHIFSQTYKNAALDNAANYSEALRVFRTLYTSEVVEPAKKKGIEVTHDYKWKKTAIPLPATLSMLIGNHIGKQGSGIQTFLYSPYPFPWRKKSGLNTSFRKKAWIELNKKPNKPFYRFEKEKGNLTLRYVTADLMRESCVGCHNTHPLTPKNNWKINDVRGVLEVVLPMQAIEEKTYSNLFATFFLMALLTLFGMVVLMFSLKRIHESSIQVEKRTLELENSKKELESFSYSVSHDLRAPIRHIDGFTKLLKKTGSSFDEEGKEYLKTIEEATLYMGELINNLLTFSRMGQKTLNYTQINLEQLVIEVQKKIEQETKDRNIHWKIEKLPLIKADKFMISQMLVNLLSNAIKYTRTREQAVIEIGCLPDEKNWIFFIRDNGVGFDMKYYDKLFGVFQRLHSQEEFEGTGAGLAIAQRIISRHQGKIWGKAIVDKEAIFYFSLPKI